jgi:hypothetical protein
MVKLIFANTVNLNKILGISLLGAMISTSALAGNDTKRGQAGAVELLINPWARTSGMAGSNSGIVRGIESSGLNIAGLAGIRRTEINFCSALYLVGSDIRINSLGFGTKVGQGAMGLTLSSFSLGTFYETTAELPDGTGNTFSPQIFNFGASYAKNFSKRISAGLLVRGISQSYNSATAFGLAFDAGIQYQTGKRKEFKFGVSILNLGPKMSFGGDAFSTRGTKQGTGYSQTLGLLTAAFEQPSMLNIGFGYDFYTNEDLVKITPCFNFRSNSFTADQYQVGVQASWKDMFMVRGGYDYQDGIINKSESTTTNLGPSFGATFQMPFTRKSNGDMAPAEGNDDLYEGTTKSKVVAIDYSYSMTRYFGGTHRFSILLSL